MFNTCLSWFLFDVVGICDIIFLSKVCTHLCKWRSIYKLSRQADTCMSMDAIHTIISALWILGFKRPVFTFIMLSSYGDECMAINKDHWFPCIKNQNVHCVCLRVFQIDIMTIFFFENANVGVINLAFYTQQSYVLEHKLFYAESLNFFVWYWMTKV